MKICMAYPFPLTGMDSNGTTSTPTPSGNCRSIFYPFAKRFVETYRQHPPGADHEVLVVFGCRGGSNVEDRAIFDGLPVRFVEYGEGGLDCGSAIFASHHTDCEFLVSMTSRVYFHRAGALQRLADARDKFGERGLYGAIGTYERLTPHVFPNPHIRTVWYGARAEHFRKYPFKLKHRPDVHQFEAGELSFTNWHLDNGYPVKMVTWDDYHDLPDWRRKDLKDIFRRGTQEQCLVFDKHTDLWRDADKRRKMEMARGAGDTWLK